MVELSTLCNLEEGQKGIVEEVLLKKDSIRRRMFDLGIVKGTEIKCMYKSPYGDPTAYGIRGTVIAIRKEDASLIKIKIL